ncbi:hypothetical protein [Photobacterium damselae]|uniref:hypothetical protein n=1 Tax=Photobacterium damselae TaxID=38293 RepID=UPI001F2B9793|nr:hypothetical protein [Photobacterium damselae]UKA04732.1 hypothetical protein IHC89_21055 [Photobacterium damselae subsp. damselae]
MSQQPFENFPNQNFIFHERKEVKFEVLYFFNLNCPTCIRFEKFLKPWLLRNQKNVSIREIPAPVKPSWQLANNVYFAAKILNPRLSFLEIMSEQEKRRDAIYNYQSAEKFVNRFHHYSSDEIASVLFSETVFNLVDYSTDLYKKFDVSGTPTMILITRNHNTYKVSPEFTDTFPEMLTVLDALISYNSTNQKKK